jgi:vitamin B12 transporter
MRYLSAALAPALLFPAIAPAQSVFDLDEIVFSVNATETEQNRVGNSVTVITEEDLEATGDLQLTDYLARLPGVTLTQNGPQGGTADVRIRGARGRYISVYVDGILVTDPSGTVIAYEDFGGLTTGSIRRIEVLRGSQSALYGGTAVGGVINISTIAGTSSAEGTAQTLGIEAGSYDTYALSYGLTQRTGPLTLSFGIDHTRSDGFSAAEENTGNTEPDGFDRSRLSFGANFEVNDALTIGFNGFVEDGSTEFDEFGPIDGTPDESSSRETLGVRLFVEWQQGRWSHDVAFSSYAIERTSLGNGATSVFNGERLSFDYVGSVEASNVLSLSFGLNAQREEATYANVSGGIAKVDTFGAFAEAIWSPTTDFDLTATLRGDDHESFGKQNTGRLAFAWRPRASTVVRGAVGTGYRAPSIDELFGNYPSSNFVGSPRLVPEESLSAELGFEHSLANGARLSGTIFRLDIENLVTYQSGTPATLVNTPGTSKRRGYELAAALPLNDSMILTGAYTRTIARTAQRAPLQLVPEHDIALGLDAEWGNGWSSNVTAKRVIGSFEGSAFLKDYTILNGSIGYEIVDGIETYLRVHNLTNEEYQTRRGYGTSDRAFYVGLRSRF